MSLHRLVVLELRRSFPRRTWAALLGTAVAVSGASTLGLVHTARPRPTVAEALAQTAPGFLVVVIGVLIYANELRHATLARWTLVVGGRGRLVAAKVVAALVAGAAVSLSAGAGTRVVATAAGAAGSPVTDQLLASVRAALALALLAGLAAAVAALAHGVVAPMVVMLAAGPVFEATVSGASAAASRWLPNALVSAIRVATPGAPSMVAATVALAGWVVVVSGVAGWCFARRDLGAGAR